MDNTEIYSKRYTSSDKNALVSYIAKAYPSRKDLSSFIDFTLSYMPLGGEEMSLLIYRGQEIIGANMFLRTKARIGSEEQDIVWSYDTKVLDDYRQTDAGTLICGELFSIKNLFGAGLSQISIELQRRMRSKFIAKSVAFIRFNRYLLRYILCPFSLRHGGLL